MKNNLQFECSDDPEGLSREPVRRAPSVVRLLPSVANKLRVIGATVNVSDDTGTIEDTGLLVGKLDDTTAVVEDLIRFSPGDSFSAQQSAKISATNILGWYWASDNEFSTLSERHVDYFKNSSFRRISDLFLLLKPGPQAALMAECYAKSPHGPFSLSNHRYGTVALLSNEQAPEPLEIKLSGIAGRVAPIFLVREPDANASVPPFASAPPNASASFGGQSGPVLIRPDGAPIDPALRPTGGPGKVSRLIWVTAAGILFATASVTFTSTYLRSSAAIAAIGRIQLASARKNLGMHVEPVGGDLQLTWDHKVTAQGANAVLSIRDGESSREINLDPKDLSDGSLVYHPASPHVVFDLLLQYERGAGLEDRVEFGTAPISNLRVEPANEQSARVKSADAEPAKPVMARVQKAMAKPAKPVKRSAPSRIASPEKFAALQVPESMYLARPKTSDLSAIPPTVDSPAGNSTSAAFQPAIDLPLTVPFDPALGDASPSYSASASPKRSPEPDIPRGAEADVSRVRRPSKLDAYVPAKVVTKFMPNAKGLGEVIKEASTVQLQIRIDKTGHVERAQVVGHTGNFSDLVEEASVSTVKQWTFEPAKERGSNVDSDYTVVLHFAPRE